MTRRSDATPLGLTDRCCISTHDPQLHAVQMSRTHRDPPSHTQQPFTPVPPVAAHSARVGLSLTSRSRPATVHGVSRPQPRYDPRAVLAARTQAIKSQSPPRFQRRVVRPRGRSPDALRDTSAASREIVDPVTRAHHEHKEAAWKAPSTYSSMYNEARHKSQQALFSTAPPMVRKQTHEHARIERPTHLPGADP